jgi:hypothetical protein
MVGLQVVLLGAPTSLASIIVVVVGPHHPAATGHWWPSHTLEVASESEVGQREHMVRPGIHRKC